MYPQQDYYQRGYQGGYYTSTVGHGGVGTTPTSYYPPVPPPKKTSKKIKIMIAIIVVTIIIIPSFLYWHFSTRPRSIRELAEDGGFPNPGQKFSFRSYKPGDTTTLEGTITNITVMNTTYGVFTRLELDDFKALCLIGEHGKKYTVGERISTTIHFNEYWYNGQSFVWADELDWPFPYFFIVMNIVTSAVSTVGGVTLVPEPSETIGQMKYTVYLPRGTSFPLDMFNVSVQKGTHTFFEDYIDMSHCYYNCPKIAHMDPLVDGTAGVLTFKDADGDSNLSEGDYFLFNIPPTENRFTIETYYLSIPVPTEEGFWQDSILYGGAYLVNSNRGFYDLTLPDKVGNFLFLQHEGDVETAPAQIQSTISVRKALGFKHGYATCRVKLVDDDTKTVVLSQNIIPGTINGEGGVTLSFSDENFNQILDDGDTFVIEGLPKWQGYELYILYPERGVIADIRWVTGIGSDSGNYPHVRFAPATAPNASQPYDYDIKISEILGKLGEKLSSFLVRVFEDGNEIYEEPLWLKNGTIATTDGKTLLYTDADFNERLTVGDYFTVQNCKQNARYDLKLEWRDNTVAQVSWRCEV